MTNTNTRKGRSRRERPEPVEPVEHPVDLNAIVQAYAAQAAAADQLADVDTTHLDTAHVNPNALAVLNNERDSTARERIRLDYERERLEIEADHQRRLDRHRAERRMATAQDARAERAVTEGLADADEATEQLGTIREFEREASPASAATALTRAVRVWRREEFVNAIVGSALSAVGIAALLVAVTSLTWWVAPLVAAAAEVVLTMRVVRLISQRATLAERHKGQALSAEGRAALVFMGRQIIALLAVSVLINIGGLIVATGWLGVIGVVGSISAAVASWSASRVSVAVTETVRSNVAAWQGGDWVAARAELRTRAAGAHIPTLESTNDSEPTAMAVSGEDVEIERVRRVLAVLADEQIAALAERGTTALSAMLDRPSGTEGGAGTVGCAPQGPSGGATPADLAVPRDATPSATPVADATPAVETGPAQERSWPRPPTPEQGRRQLVEYAQWRLSQGQVPSLGDAAERMNTTKRSIARYRDALEADYPDLMGAFPRPQS
ncbi:hypothetical protein ACFWZ7_24775 [Nocardiopsis alba]|uniref:hypothetical protein n=1 Tax=Nocardiopsis alba TaxID=53437 RepID=UPI00367000FE